MNSFFFQFNNGILSDNKLQIVVSYGKLQVTLFADITMNGFLYG